MKFVNIYVELEFVNSCVELFAFIVSKCVRLGFMKNGRKFMKKDV